jgi:hypothetical protein
MSKPVAAIISILISLCVVPDKSRAEYFSNMGGGKGIEAQQASSKAFAGLAQLMTGLSALELSSNTDAKTHLSTAMTTIEGAAGEFQSLSQKYAGVALEVKYPDALAQLAQTAEVSPDKIATVGDVWSLTSQSLQTTAKSLEAFASEPTKEKYTDLRTSIENTLRTGDLSSKLLE